MLSAAGVGYFELDDPAARAGTLGLDIPLDQVDDVLNSLVVFDDHGGVGSIELPGRDDAHRAFADVPFAQAMLNSPADMLASLRGEEIAVAGPAAMTGRIVSAISEPLATPGGDRAKAGAEYAASHTRVTLLTTEGFRQFILEDAASVRLTNPALAARVGAALVAARTQAASSSRHLSLRLGGDAPGRVTVGYVVAAPLWKASYRVVLPAAAGDQARVQGWAVLENQSGQDWKAVDLTLQSGNPVTFHQAIYASYYADRPEVPVDVIGRVLPDEDERVIAKAQGSLEERANRRMRTAPAPYMNAEMAPPPPPAPSLAPQAAASAVMAPPETQAAATETMLDTTFHIAAPIDLPRGHTASVPILDREMKAEQLDWLQADATRPITALRLTNDSDTSLPPGVLTLYTQDPASGAAFAGDARLSGLPAGQSRLLGFAEDLRTTATRSLSEQPETLVHITVSQGIVHRTVRHRLATTVELTAPAHDPRRILVEFARAPDATLSFDGGPTEGVEETARAWRVPVSLAPGQTRKLAAYTDTMQTEEESLLQDGGGLDETVLAQFTSDATLDASTRARLQPLIALQTTASGRRIALKALTDAQDAAAADEERIRNNLRVVAGPGDLHEKLLAQLANDEMRLNDLRAKIGAAQAGVADAQHALADAVGKLAF